MLTQGIDIRASPLHNVGLFAIEPIPAGTVVWLPCTRCPRWSADEAAALPAGRYASLDKYGHTLTDGSLLLPCLGAFLMNHSCAANVLDFGLDFGVAVRDIAVGEEVTCDYATFVADDGWSMECLCRSPECRGEVSTAQGGEDRITEPWNDQVERALKQIPLVAQPLHDVLSDLSEPYRRALSGISDREQVSTGATIWSPSFMTTA